MRYIYVRCDEPSTFYWLLRNKLSSKYYSRAQLLYVIVRYEIPQAPAQISMYMPDKVQGITQGYFTGCQLLTAVV